GVTRYTIGQRRGLNVAVGDPLFVVRIDAAARQVVVGPREALLTHALTLKEASWIGDGPSLAAACDAGRPVLARVRPTREPEARHGREEEEVDRRRDQEGRRAARGPARPQGREDPRRQAARRRQEGRQGRPRGPPRRDAEGAQSQALLAPLIPAQAGTQAESE